MPDMLVKLYTLPVLGPALAEQVQHGIEIRRPNPTEAKFLSNWVRTGFEEDWALGCEFALRSWPPTCFIAVKKVNPAAQGYQMSPETLMGFACYDVSARGMFGPLGVAPDCQGQGIGKALLLACLHAMANEGYAYAVIGWAGPLEFYARTVGATVIQGSEPGIYRGPLVDSGWTAAS
jgi:GNAT superfamily N-acetyltransferase